MLKLMKLEWKKNRLGKEIRIAVITSAVLLLFIMAMTGELEASETIESYGKSMVNTAVELFTHMTYIIFTGVMLASWVVNSYENKTIHLMFSYPIDRRKILLSKFLSVWIFNFIAIILTKILIYAVLLLTSSYTRISTESIQIGELSFWLNIILSSAAMVSISFISLLVGMKMKSSRAAIVAAVIVAALTQGSIGDYTLSKSVTFYVILLTLAAVSVYLSVYNVETKDV